MYITRWEDFQEAAEALYEKEPVKTRYSIKWKPNDGLVLKITDDTTCLKFKTRSSIVLNRFEAMNLSLMRKMQNRKPPVVIPTPTTRPVETGATDPVPATATQAAAANAPAAAAGVKKKKPSKKKK